ncbi:ABC transporter permease [Pasteurellaceae bacterium 20609_3]|uniref:ABC transporter permease n=1 Tax=Spirabiliibacterium mucosae TaxID=28156 RepID=UPI001AAD9C55|nr:ABC transporter permease [Spirabiliibacterium mucosae]MBE2897576.1 ABC transporter permease [Spirabiliibacterium mucosae]
MRTLFGLSLILLLSAGISLFIGASNVTLSGLWQLEAQQWTLLTVSRLPRLVSILIAGSALSVCGLVMQNLSRNRFVSPTTAGTMDSARLGILLAIVLFPHASMLAKTLVAVVVAFAGTLVFMLILRRIKFKDVIFVPLVGIMFGNIISAITLFIALKLDVLQNLSGWLQGDFSLMMTGRFELLYISLPALVVVYLFARYFTIAGLGADMARTLGLNYNAILYLGLLIVALITSLVIVTVGMIPFLGLIVPNLVTLFWGDNLKRVLPLTALCGALFVLLCDIAGRVVIYPYEIAINTIVGVLGSGLFLLILFKGYRHA